MNSVDITIHLSNTSIGDVKTIDVTTSDGTVTEFDLLPPSGSGQFSTAYAAPAAGKYCVAVEVPADSDPVRFPGPVDDPPKTGA